MSDGEEFEEGESTIKGWADKSIKKYRKRTSGGKRKKKKKLTSLKWKDK
jgi:hypothetical protein